jgi:uncharacterized coiled-coil protein SlyX
MGSLFEELDAREAASRARIEELRRQVAELTQAIEHEEATLSRLVITRETVTEILGPAPAEGAGAGAGAGESSTQVGQESGAAAGSPIGGSPFPGTTVSLMVSMTAPVAVFTGSAMRVW